MSRSNRHTRTPARRLRDCALAWALAEIFSSPFHAMVAADDVIPPPPPSAFAPAPVTPAPVTPAPPTSATQEGETPAPVGAPPMAPSFIPPPPGPPPVEVTGPVNTVTAPVPTPTPAQPPPPSPYSSGYSSAPPPEPPPPYAWGPRRRYGGGWNPSFNSSYADFRLSEVGFFQSGTRQFSILPSWNPEFDLRSGQYFGFNLGGTILTNSLGQNFLAAEAQLVLGTRLGDGPFGVEGGLGIQEWTGDNGTSAPLLSGNLFYSLGHGLIERIFVGYSAVLMDYFYTSELKVGLGFSL